jgi:hypothetical protein
MYWEDSQPGKGAEEEKSCKKRWEVQGALQGVQSHAQSPILFFLEKVQYNAIFNFQQRWLFMCLIHRDLNCTGSYFQVTSLLWAELCPSKIYMLKS